MKRRENPNNSAALKAHFNAPLLVGARDNAELWDKGNEAGKGFAYHFMSFAGTRGPVTYRDVVFSWLMEVLAAIIITMGVGLGRWYESTDNVINALVLAAFTSISFYVATRLPSDEKLPVHGNGMLTVAHMFTRDVGFWGFWLYISAQFIGCMIGGGLGLGFLLQNLPRTLTRNLIPVPLTTGANPTSLITVILVEIFFGAFFALVVLLKEFLNTLPERGDVDAKGRSNRNYRKATKLGAFTLFWLVLLGYQFGVYTFSNVAYFGPLFAGTHGYTNDLGNINHQVALNSAVFADSVFGADSSISAFFTFMLTPFAAGILAALVFLLFWFAGKQNGSADGYANRGPGMEYMHDNIASNAPVSAVSPMSIASASPGLRSPLNPNGMTQ